jgi:flagellar L-ring protein precursor FlgH
MHNLIDYSLNNSAAGKVRIALGLVIFCSTAICAPTIRVRADSLFPVQEATKALRGSSSAGAASLFSDTRAHSVGDILTVTIAESTSASSTATTKTSHDDSVSAFGGTGLLQRFIRDLSLTANNSRSGSGTGSTTRAGSLTTTLSVVVKEVLPNNTLRIEGTRLVGINRETQRVTFVGVVRPEDIAPDNTVPSNLIAGVEVRYDGKGIVGDTQRPGILSRIFRFLF